MPGDELVGVPDRIGIVDEPQILVQRPGVDLVLRNEDRPRR